MNRAKVNKKKNEETRNWLILCRRKIQPVLLLSLKSLIGAAFFMENMRRFGARLEEI
jgi:hypothetical protein